MTEFTTIMGMPVMISGYALESYQYRFPKSKKKRIRKKWAKRDINFKSRPGAYIVDKEFGFDSIARKQKILICHPLVLETIKERLTNK